MAQKDRFRSDQNRVVSRRDVVKGGLMTATGVLAALLSAQPTHAAVTPLDVKRLRGATPGVQAKNQKRVLRSRLLIRNE